jgi:hypothetical protein
VAICHFHHANIKERLLAAEARAGFGPKVPIRDAGPSKPVQVIFVRRLLIAIQW